MSMSSKVFRMRPVIRDKCHIGTKHTLDIHTKTHTLEETVFHYIIGVCSMLMCSNQLTIFEMLVILKKKISSPKTYNENTC